MVGMGMGTGQVVGGTMMIMEAGEEEGVEEGIRMDTEADTEEGMGEAIIGTDRCR